MATVSGSAAWRALPGDASTRRYQLAPGQHVSGGSLQLARAPQYPPALLPLHLARVVVVVRLVIGTDGRVQRVLPLPPSQLADITHGPAFFAAIEHCTEHWRFVPLRIAASARRSAMPAADAPALPFSLDYAFSFAVHDGKPLTTLEQR